jgi:amino acid transporter
MKLIAIIVFVGYIVLALVMSVSFSSQPSIEPHSAWHYIIGFGILGIFIVLSLFGIYGCARFLSALQPRPKTPRERELIRDRYEALPEREARL